MSGIIGVSPNMRSGVVGEGSIGHPHFSAHITTSHGSQPSGTILFFRSSGNSGSASNYGITTLVDTHNSFNSSTGVFLPKTKGLYLITGWFNIDNIKANGRVNTSFKDQDNMNIGYQTQHSAFVQAVTTPNTIVHEMNGTTNSVMLELYFESDQAEVVLGGVNHSRFSACKIA